MNESEIEIRTQHCLLRRFEEADLPDFMAYRNNKAWMKHQGLKGLSKQEYRGLLLGEHSFRDGVQFAVVCTETNALLGDIYLKREIDAFWIGCTICPAKARQGYAYEVISSVIALLREKGVFCLKAGVAPKNTPSIRLFKKLNFCTVSSQTDEQVFRLQLR